MSIDITDTAYCKIMLHLLKHTSKDCFGVLLGYNDNDKLVVQDAIPFFHEKIFAPQLDIGLKMVEMFSENNLQIVGIYENLIINAMKEDLINSPHALYICENFHNKKMKNPLLFEISSVDVSTDDTIRPVDEIIFRVYIYLYMICIYRCFVSMGTEDLIFKDCTMKQLNSLRE